MKYSKHVFKCLISFAFFPMLIACSASDYHNSVPNEQKPADPVAEKPIFQNTAEGAINGRAWSFASGAASLFKRNGKYYLEIKLWNQIFNNPCEVLSGSTYQIRLYADNFVNQAKIDPADPFTLIPTIIFSDMSDYSPYRNNMVASSGLIQINSLANGRVVGAVSGSFSAAGTGRTEVAGNFDVPLCRQKSGSD